MNPYVPFNRIKSDRQERMTMIRNLKKQSRQLILIIYSCIILCGSIVCMKYNNMMITNTEQQLCSSSSFAVNHLNLIIDSSKKMLEIKKLEFDDKTTAVFPFLKSIAIESNITDAAAWIYNGKRVQSSNGSIKYDTIKKYISDNEHRQVSEPFLYKGQYYIDAYTNLSDNTLLGIRFPLNTLFENEQSGSMNRIMDIHTWVLNAANDIIIGEKTDITPIMRNHLPGHYFRNLIKYKTSDNHIYLGVQSEMNDIGCTLICTVPFSTMIQGIIFTDTFCLTVIIVTLLVILALLHNLFTEYKTKQYDKLTGTFSQYAFRKKASKYIQKNKKADSKFCFIQMDLHRLNIINERYGILYGNIILKKTAIILKNTLPPGSLITRVYSDKFCFLMQYTLDTDIYEQINNITKSIQDIDKSNFPVYFGIYLYNDVSINIRSAMEYANFALKSAEESSAACENYCIFNEDMLKDINFNSQLQSEMYNALEEGQFKVYLQPKCSMTSRKVVGAEALVRWEHPEKGLLSPNLFIPLFEKNGFIKKLDEFMWESTAKIIHEWIHEGYNAVPISVNISRAQKLGTPLCKKLNKIVSKYKIPVKYLELEFTESAFSENIDELYSTMKRLHTDGFTLLMDDFGSGYSSLNMLKECPADIIKIDKEFLNSGLNEQMDENSIIIIQHIIQMIKNMNLDVVAEGVETKEHIKLLTACGCDTAQGYYFSPPVPVDQFNQYAADVLKSNSCEKNNTSINDVFADAM